MWWLRLLGSFKLWVSFEKAPYKRDYILQKTHTYQKRRLKDVERDVQTLQVTLTCYKEVARAKKRLVHIDNDRFKSDVLTF